MSTISVIGAGAFGTALAITLAREGHTVVLWGRDAAAIEGMAEARENARYLPGAGFPDQMRPTADLPEALSAETLLIAIPAQEVRPFALAEAQSLEGKSLVSCAKGIDLESGVGPAATLSAACRDASVAVLTGPGFAADLARGLPTALTLAATGPGAPALQARLSGATLRLYRTEDIIGAELGGALKNVIALAAGLTMGAGLGESARASVVTRGFAEIQRLAEALGARPETLAGLSGFGDLVLTCTSEKSRNYGAGLALGREAARPGGTVEGVATARAVVRLAAHHGIEMPISAMVAAVLAGRLSVAQARKELLTRPLKEE
ncbi:MAG: NAD(P)H-dependent glycerol-3-phosphate dehydrogenase [Pseudomonadota bacterium]